MRSSPSAPWLCLCKVFACATARKCSCGLLHAVLISCCHRHDCRVSASSHSCCYVASDCQAQHVSKSCASMLFKRMRAKQLLVKPSPQAACGPHEPFQSTACSFQMCMQAFFVCQSTISGSPFFPGGTIAPLQQPGLIPACMMNQLQEAWTSILTANIEAG